MSKYTAEQVRDIHWKMAKDYKKIPAIAEHHKAMGDSIDALLRERESAKTAVTEEMVEVAVNAHAEWFGGHRGMRAALEAVAPMLESARVPDGWQLVPREPTPEMMNAGDDCGFRSYTGTWSITPDACWQAMLAAAPKPETEE